MADIRERSGDPTLDHLIEMYLADAYVCDVEDGEEVGLPTQLETLRIREWAEGRCCEVAKHFVFYLGVDDVEAEEVDGKAHELYPELAGRGGAHTWAEVKTQRGIYAVDWAAAQYGRTEFPAVVKRG